MSNTYIKSLPEQIGQTVRIQGWVTHFRSSGKIHFIILRDGTGVVQCVVAGTGVNQVGFSQWEEIGTETAISVEGLVRADPRSPMGVEISATEIGLQGQSLDYPIAPKEHGTDF